MKQYTSSLLEEEVEIDGKVYVIREATTDVTSKYRAALLEGSEISVDESSRSRKVKGVTNTSRAQVEFLAGCLFERYEQGGETKTRPVLLLQVLKWPPRLTDELFSKAEKLSGLGRSAQEKEEEAKNSQSATDHSST